MNSEYKVILDLGNSDTRVYVRFFSKKKNRVVSKRIELSNRFYSMPLGTVVPTSYKPEHTSVIQIDGEYVGFYANGELVLREYEKISTRPTSNTSKSSFNSALSFALAVVKAVRIIAEENGVQPQDVRGNCHVVALLPPIYCNKTEIEKLEAEFRKIKTVTDMYTSEGTQLTIPVNISSVVVFPEGFAAYIGCMYDKELEIRKGYEKYETEPVLIMDVGAGTTDIMVVAGTEIIDSTKETIRTGGNNVKSKLSRMIRTKYNYGSILDSQLEKAMITGLIADGTQDIDVSDLVMMAKTEVANGLVNSVNDFLEGTDYPLRAIRGLLPAGGGTLGGNNDNITSLASVIVNLIKDFSPNIDIIELPDKLDDNNKVILEDGKPVKMSPRELNIEGALILSEAE